MKASRDINLLSDNFKSKVIDFMKEVGDIIFVTEATRTNERQAYLYSLGRNMPGNKVTWVKHSNHQDGIAIDIAFKGKELYPKDINKWKEIYKIAAKYGIDSGYDLWGIDNPHLQDNGQPYKKQPMEKFGEEKTITLDGKEYKYFGKVYNVRVEVIDEKNFDRQGLLKLHGATTYKPSYILLSTWTIKKGIDKVKEVLTHECVGHYFYNTYYTKAQKDYWSKIHNYAQGDEYFVSPYSKPLEGDKWKLRNESEHQAETLAYGYTYIKEGKKIPSKAQWNDKIAFQFYILDKFTQAVIRKHFT